MRRSLLRFLALLAAFGLVVSACSDDDDDAASDQTEDTTDDGDDGNGGDDEVVLTQDGDQLAAVKDAGVLRCGTRDALTGFAVLNEDGDHIGFDSDFCRVIAAAILGDSTAVEFVDLETSARFTALQSDEIDVLVRNTTWTAGRDGGEGATFLQPNFYDGQGMMVRTDSGFDAVSDMDGTSVCVAAGTTTEGNVAIEYQRQGLDLIEVLSFDDSALLQEAFTTGRCDGWSSDISQLSSFRSEFPEGADAVKILDDVFSKEPLAPAVRDGQAALAQAVNWAVFATIQAEEYGLTSANVDDALESDDPSVRRFLGVADEGEAFDPGLGLPTDFAYQVIKQVGSYAEIYEEHITPLGLPRGVNKLWSDGGLLYAPPYK